MLTVLSVIGTRPEAIKMAPVVIELAKHSDTVRSLVCSTGQHDDLLRDALDLFSIEPDFELAVMESNQTLSSLTARILGGLDPVVREVKPDWVLAQGDTTSVLAASLVAYYNRVRFGHVEAGLRTGDLGRPFPEEANRKLADVVAGRMFAPTARSREALLREGRSDEHILVTGNTVIDALRIATDFRYDWESGPLGELPDAKRLVLVTAHRRECFGEPILEISRAIRDLAEEFGDQGVHFVWPVHPNPNVQAPVRSILEGSNAVSLIEPLDYLSMVHVLGRVALVLTDSGGLQEESPGLGVPVLVMRDETERPEGPDAGVVRLVGTERQRIVESARHLLNDGDAWRAMATRENPYGDGYAAKRIVDSLRLES